MFIDNPLLSTVPSPVLRSVIQRVEKKSARLNRFLGPVLAVEVIAVTSTERAWTVVLAAQGRRGYGAASSDLLAEAVLGALDMLYLGHACGVQPLGSTLDAPYLPAL